VQLRSCIGWLGWVDKGNYLGRVD